MANFISQFLGDTANTVIQHSPFSTPTQTPFLARNPENQSSLTNKYRQIAPLLRNLDPSITNSIINLDSQRVAAGTAPMTMEETLAAINTARTNTPTTPPPTRSLSPLSIPGNAVRDIGDIVQSIPRLPSALLHEAQDLPNIGKRISEAQAAGASYPAALLSAPGIRMIPGTYTASNLLSGKKGIEEAYTHPLMSVLDVLPAASKLAALTPVGKAAEESARIAGTSGRPISALMLLYTSPSPR